MDAVGASDGRRDYLPTLIEKNAPALDPARLLMPGGEHREIAMAEGITVQDLIAGGIPTDLHGMLRVYNHGALIEDWSGFTTRAGDRLLIAVIPQGGDDGGKGILGAVLVIAVAVFATWAAPFVAGAVGFGTAAVWGAAITMVGTMVISALIKPPTVNTGPVGTSASKSYSLTGQSNAARPYGSCFVVYGRHKMMPAMASNPNIDNWAQTSTLTALYDFGLGYVQIEDLRIGDVDINQYQPQLVLHTNSDCRNLQLNFHRIGYDQYALAMQQNVPLIVRTKRDTFAADMDINFPKGIFQAAPKYGQLPFWADFAAWWRPVGGGAWNEVPLDWYHGAAAREYTAPAPFTIVYSGPEGVGYPGFWYEYNPTSSPADLRAKAAQWQAIAGVDDPYLRAIPNTTLGAFQYPAGDINEANYFARYPEIQARRWTRTARDHFESIGAREGRDPGVVVMIPSLGYYSPAAATLIHYYDNLYHREDGNVGAWLWIEQGSPPPPPRPTGAAPFMWSMKAGEVFDEGLYLARYPDVANAVAAGSVVNGWTHFIQWGAFEGRDPYPKAADRAVHLTAMWVGPYWMRIFFQFPTPGEYELQVVRTDKIQDGTNNAINQASGGAVTAQFNESTLALLRSYQWGLPVQPRLRHTMLEMRVTATDKLQGVVQNLSAIATSVLPVTDDGINFSWQATRNPAWIVLDLLTSEKNPKPLSRSQIDWPSWLHLVTVCNTLRYWVANGQPVTQSRYTCDIVVDSYGTVQDLAESILSGCRASLTLTTAGTWGVLHDEEKTTPRQLITPANSWGFSGARTFSVFPHALRVNFINRDNGWNKDEVTVYADGYHAGNAEIFETLDTYGITDWPHAWAYGRFMLAQGIQRSELFTLSMDVENLLVQRGDMVNVAHDVPKVGGIPARIVSVDGAAKSVMVDANLSVAPHGYAVRTSVNGWSRTGVVVTYLNESTFILDSVEAIEPDDLIVLGDYQRQTFPYLVQRIQPGADLTAELTLCKYVPGIYDADVGALPPWDPGFNSSDFISGTDLVCANLTASQLLYYVEREPRVDVVMRWTTTGIGLAYHRLTAITPSGQRYGISGDQVPQNYQWTLDALRQRFYFDMPLQIEVVPVNSNGFAGVPAYTTITLLPDRTVPGSVLMFGANVQKENVDLFWQEPNEPDISHYLLRYTPNVEVPSWDASQSLATIAWPTTKTSAGARTGAYGLRVVDTSGNVSNVEWRRTTVQHLPEINTVAVLNDRDNTPPWNGKTSHAVVDGREVRSEGDFGAVYPDGVYYVKQPIDLGDIYEVRVSSKIEAYGVTGDDYMINWVPSLMDVAAMSRGNSDLWDAWLEVRTANEMLVMREWNPAISMLDPMAMGAIGSWSAWRPCVVGDFTGRLLQFRIIIQSRNAGVRAIVTSGRIEIDMPDRVDAYGDIDVPPAGIDFVFPVSFRVLQSVAITINGNDEPVVAEVSNKQPTGFHVRIVNTQTHAGTDGVIDILAQGYGRRRDASI